MAIKTKLLSWNFVNSKKIKLLSVIDENKEIFIKINYCTNSSRIEVLNPIFAGHISQGGNLFENFQKLNADLQKSGYIPLCNGARKDVSLSGAVSDISKGAMLYQGDPRDSLPLVYIFDEAKVETIDKPLEI